MINNLGKLLNIIKNKYKTKTLKNHNKNLFSYDV